MRVSVIVSALATAAQLTHAIPYSGAAKDEFNRLTNEHFKRLLDSDGGIEVKGVGYHEERFLEEEGAELRKRFTNENVVNAATGVREGGSGNQKVLRREIRDFVQLRVNDVYVHHLFLLALARLYDNFSASNPIGYWQLAAVHGRPYQTWNNDLTNPPGGAPTRPGNANSGYCTHSSTLFPPWHRPYLALLEEQIYQNAKVIATQAKYQKYDWRAALLQIRLPYWDTSANALVPNVLRQETWVIPRDPMTGRQETKRNPLYHHWFEKPNTYRNFPHYPLNIWQLTKRAPVESRPGTSNPYDANTPSRNDRVESYLRGQQTSLRDRTRRLFTSNRTWRTFSNKQNTGSGDPDSLEAIHDVIHGGVGQGGHMSYVDYSSFDPIFFLHHCNVDRLYAMWQAVNPGHTIYAQRNGGGTYGIPPNTIEDGKTYLRPWKGISGAYWTGEAVADWHKFGYGYPEIPKWRSEFQGSNGATNLRNYVLQQVSNLYGGSMQQVAAAKKKRDLSKRQDDVVVDIPNADNKTITGIDESIRDNKYTDWRADIEVDRTAGNGTFFLHFFLDRPSKNPADWPTQEGLVGSYCVFTHAMTAAPGIDPAEVNNMVTGAVPLTEALIKHFSSDGLRSLRPEDVIEFLQKKLKWRAATASGERISVRKLKGLTVKISKSEVSLPVGDEIFGEEGPWVEVGEIVRKIGRYGGDLAPGVLPPVPVVDPTPTPSPTPETSDD